MINKLFEDEDGNVVHLLDAEGIDYLIDGLRELRDEEPDTELTTPTVHADEEGVMQKMGLMILRRAEDVDTPEG